MSNGIDKLVLSNFTHPKGFLFHKLFYCQINIRNFISRQNITK